MAKPGFEREEAVATESKTRLKKPPLYKVLIHNDDFTTMDFVVYVLQSIFQLGEAEAVNVMLKVHTEGVGIAGIYPYEIAEMKVAEVVALAEANEFPLLCTIEEN